MPPRSLPRRRLLGAAAALSALAPFRSALSQGDGRMRSWPLKTPRAHRHPRRRPGARRRRLVHRAAQRPSRLVRSEDRQHRADRAGQRLLAARRDHGPGQGRVDHRRRAERDRARELAAAGGASCIRFRGHAVREPQHLRVRRRRRPLVHRAERLRRQGRGEDRRGDGERGAEGARALRHLHDAARRRVVVLARRLVHRADRSGAPASRTSSSRRRRTRARGACGATARAASGWPSGCPVSCRCTTRARGAAGGSSGRRRARTRASTRCTWTSATRSGLSDWGANVMLRFDPRDGEVRVLPVAPRDANVRQILGRPGEVWLPESGTEHITVIRAS